MADAEAKKWNGFAIPTMGCRRWRTKSRRETTGVSSREIFERSVHHHNDAL